MILFIDIIEDNNVKYISKQQIQAEKDNIKITGADKKVILFQVFLMKIYLIVKLGFRSIVKKTFFNE